MFQVRAPTEAMKQQETERQKKEVDNLHKICYALSTAWEYPMRLTGYSKIYNLGHRALDGFLNLELLVEEKVDGSQFSFGLSTDGSELEMRTKRVRIMPELGGKLFNAAMKTVENLFNEGKLKQGYTYRGEVLSSPRHNTLTYGRVPEGNVVIYDIDTGQQHYLDYDQKYEECKALGLECIPRLWQGKVTTKVLEEVMESASFLEGTIEGVVLKPVGYDVFDADKKVLMGKLVATTFREKNHIKVKKTPSTKDFLLSLADALATDARFEKSVQAMRDDGMLTNSTSDIGALMKVIVADIREEEGQWLEDEIVKHFKPDRLVREVLRAVASRIPDWYKAKLLDGKSNAES